MVFYNQFRKSHVLCLIFIVFSYQSTTSVFATTGSNLSLYCYDKQASSGGNVQLGQCSRDKSSQSDQCELVNNTGDTGSLDRYYCTAPTTASTAKTAAAESLSAMALGPTSTLNPALVAEGRRLYFEGTFNGNGRTCATCHPKENNFAIDPEFIASLPDNDPLFVAENNPDLATLERPELMRKFGVILENVDGFEEPNVTFVMRGVPHVLGLQTSVDSAQGPRTGWSGDGAPDGDFSLENFVLGAVIQHYPLTLNRVPGVDFRLPTEQEMIALAEFLRSLGRQQEIQLPLALKDERALKGQEIFSDIQGGKCFGCHAGAGANGDPNIFPGAGNLNLDTGVEDLPNTPRLLTDITAPFDDGFGFPGDGTFNVPSIIEAADTAPFFHNNAVHTLESAVAFYNSDAFNNSPAGVLVTQATGSPLTLEGTDVDHISAFLRVINTLDNMRNIISLLNKADSLNFSEECEFFFIFLCEEGEDQLALDLIAEARADCSDIIQVLRASGLHPKSYPQFNRCVSELRNAERLMGINEFDVHRSIRRARNAVQNALPEIAEESALAAFGR